MQIVIDVDVDKQGNIIAQHVIETDRLPWNKVDHPTLPGQKLDLIDFLAFLQVNRATIATAGHGLLTKHPAYPGKSRWEVIVAEAKKTGVPAAVSALGLT